ncbi:unnamed protein product, partial [Protopolystoma xenopodis]
MSEPSRTTVTRGRWARLSRIQFEEECQHWGMTGSWPAEARFTCTCRDAILGLCKSECVCMQTTTNGCGLNPFGEGCCESSASAVNVRLRLQFDEQPQFSDRLKFCATVVRPVVLTFSGAKTRLPTGQMDNLGR